ncbi:hypothetical protein KC318_g3538 [Hortaea werneckii]|uniref:CENP-V/GFA domain-containing protein n=1 Tax=Hortaea werneckii TaxID=91943 RepID=A0A3M6ZP46_HORWE|nr:hypothetical protein KC334_g3683 [Hortaea werneckii]KAI7019605.1 hypothetical protein KC355_g2994 [Hortaea werneckii]KAI7671367.1 hypothetical protein KC318_g3538 [Hortaea werneckii]RMY16870.1 hypothetical protein D0867_06377 [Hortaea werneckii]RMY32382.1 hypothetical protein D0866_06653 [Hortaea werneckii]
MTTTIPISTSPSTHSSKCHCGAITLRVRRLPDHINVCQCTICRRYGAAWGYYDREEVQIECQPETATTRQYIWGDGNVAFNFCERCGCVCYWCPKNSPSPGEETRVGINTNNMDPEVLRFVDRKYDFSILKRPLRDQGTAHPDDLAEY